MAWPLAGCGGGGSPAPAAAPASAAVEPIWGAGQAADTVASNLAFLKQAAFPATVFNVMTYGAQTITPIASNNPYVNSSVSSTAQVTASLNGSLTPTNGSALTNPSNAFDSRPAFLAAIAACNAAGGGQVLVPSGNYYCAGPIVLLSNVNFHLASNCTIYFSPNPADYAKDGPYNSGANGHLYYARWQGNDCLNYGSPIYAYNQTNIAITGTDQTSVLNGQAMTPFAGSGSSATCWWTYKGTTNAWGCASSATTPGEGYANTANLDLATAFTMTQAPNIWTNGATNWLYTLLGTSTAGGSWSQDSKYLPALAEAGVEPFNRIFGLGHYLPPPMIQFIGCRNVLMENYTTQCTPFWQHNPVNCTNVVVRGVFADSIGPNNDGFDPDACTNVLIDTVTFNTGDDCIAVKSGKDGDVYYGSCNNILIQNCTMNSGHGGITLGSEMSAGVNNVYARNLTMQNANWATNPLNIAIRFKTNLNRGGSIQNVYVNGVTLPNGIMTIGKTDSTGLSGSPINTGVALGVAGTAAGNPSTSQGGVITFDCDYSPSSDAVRIRPPQVNNVQIQNVTVSNVTVPSSPASSAFSTALTPVGTQVSCFQAIVMQGPVKTDYNGPLATPPAVLPISNVSISNCNFGTPVQPATAVTPGTSPSAIYLWNVSNLVLNQVQIAGLTMTKTLNDPR